MSKISIEVSFCGGVVAYGFGLKLINKIQSIKNFNH